MTKKSEYAAAGVDPRKITKFKELMKSVGERTKDFPAKRDVKVKAGAHGARFAYIGSSSHAFFATQEGLGNKNWIAEWMYEASGGTTSFYYGIGWDTALMAVNDLITSGAMPVAFLDEVAAGDSDWFDDDRRSADLAESYFRICKEVGMTIPAGESPSLRYLVKAYPPVKSAPVLSGCAIGILSSLDYEIPSEVQIGDSIIGFASSGVHCNGISALINRVMQMPDKFLTKLPHGATIGEEILTPTQSYVRLVETLRYFETPVHKLLPGTGDGIAKLAIKAHDFTSRIDYLPKMPPVEQCMLDNGMTLEDCLTTFNCGIGYYAFVHRGDVRETMQAAVRAGIISYELGQVVEGERCVILGPHGGLKLFPQDQ